MSSLILTFGLDFSPAVDEQRILELVDQGGDIPPVLCENVHGTFSLHSDRGFTVVHGCNAFVTSLEPGRIMDSFIDDRSNQVYILESSSKKGGGLLLHVFNAATGEFCGDAHRIGIDEPITTKFYIAGISAANKQIVIHSPSFDWLFILDLTRRSCEKFHFSRQCSQVHLFACKPKALMVVISRNNILIFDWKTKVMLFEHICKWEADGISTNLIMTSTGPRFAVYHGNIINIIDISLQMNSVISNEIILECGTCFQPKWLHFIDENDFVMLGKDDYVYGQVNFNATRRISIGFEDAELSGKYVSIRRSNGLISHFELSANPRHFVISCLQPAVSAISSVCAYNYEFVLLGYSDGRIHLHPCEEFLAGHVSLLPLHEFHGHIAAVTSFLVPSLQSVEGEDCKYVDIFLSGDECGNVFLWDLVDSKPQHVFRAHTQPIISIIQPLPETFEELSKLSGTQKDDMHRKHISKPRKRQTESSKSGVSIKHHDNSSRSSLSSVEVHSTLHRLLLCISRSFYAITSDNVVVLLDWSQKRIGWILNGVPEAETIISCKCALPDAESLELLLERNSNILPEELDQDLRSNSAIVELTSGSTSTYWLLFETGGIHLGTLHELKLAETSLILFNMSERQFNRSFLTKYSPIAIESKSIWRNIPLCHINVKHLIVLNELTDISTKEHDEALLLSVFYRLFPNHDTETFKSLIGRLPCLLENENNSVSLKFRPVVKYSEQRFVYSLEFFSPSCKAFPNKAVCDLAAVSLSLIVFLKILEAKPGNEHNCATLISYILNDVYQESDQSWNMPSISWLAKYYNDPMPIVREGCKSLFRATLLKQSISDMENIFDIWYPALPSVQTPDTNSMSRACVILSALAYEESRRNIKNEIPYVIGISSSENNANPSIRAPVKLSQSSEQQLVLSLISLLLSQNIENIADTSESKRNILHRCIAVEFLGLMWNEWKHVYVSLSTNHVQSLNALGKSPSINAPLFLFILKKMWQLGAQSVKNPSTPDGEVTKLKRTRRKSLPFRKNKLTFAMTSIDDMGSNVASDLDVEAMPVTRSKTRDGFNSANILPYVRKDLQLAYGEDRIASLRLLITCTRNAIAKISRQDGAFYIHTLCTELLNAGLRDGDWERVRCLLKAGVGVVIKHIPIVFFPTYLPYVIETMIKACLDPVIPFSIREGLSGTLSPILQQIVQIYPTVSFHGHTQKLCIGTGIDSTEIPAIIKEHTHPPGLLIIWDLKTATRVQIIRAHESSNIAAVSFNLPSEGETTRDKEPLLASYSHEDGFVKFYQHAGILSSIAAGIKNSFIQRPVDETVGLFHNLAGAGQLRLFREFKVDELNGSSRSQLGFHRGRKSSIAAVHILQQIRLSWINDRSVKLKRQDPLPSLTFTV